MSMENLQERVLETLETDGPLTVSDLVERFEEDDSSIRGAVSGLEGRNLIHVSISEDTKRVEGQSPVPISQLAFRGDLTPTQAVIRYFYEEHGYGQTQIARILNYSPGNIQTNIERIRENLGRELEQGEGHER